MKVTFKINYNTNWGESLYISGSVPELGNNQYSKAVPMKYEEGGNWTATVEFNECKTFSYRYYVLAEDKRYWTEWGKNRYAVIIKDAPHIYHDQWRTNGVDKTYYSSAFTEGLIVHKPENEMPKPLRSKSTLAFTISAPYIKQNYAIGILGSCKELGDWKESNVVLLNDALYPLWIGLVNPAKMPDVIEYKYVVYDKIEKRVVAWEWGENRTLYTKDFNDSIYVKRDEVLRYGIGGFKCAGVAIPVFSLRTNNSFGIGEFSDIKLMVDWANKTGQKVIQTLPINDTTRFRTNADSYPYSAITVMGLHPIYINPFEIGELADKAKMKDFEIAKETFNASPTVMYQEVCAKKWEYFQLIFKQIGKKVLASKEYKDFDKENAEWLHPYACFCTLRDYYKTSNFREWEQPYNHYNKEYFKAIQKEAADKLNIHLFLQFMAHKQLLSATQYASEHGVVLKGDIPIGISPESVEAWTDPQLFNLDSQAGAPPDPFSETGQNWGFPTYNWQAMSHDGYKWWMQRFQKMGTYFKVYRIDHVLGFFRIWRMNGGDVQGLLGQFDPALPMTEQEICSYGTWFEYHRMTHPFIREYMLGEMFGSNANFVKQTFLEMVTSGIYRFRSEYPNQRAVEAFFNNNDAAKLGLSEDDRKWIYGGVMSLFTEVLFIEDCHEKGKFHPRIGMQNTYSFRELDWNVQQALNRLYDDFFYRRHNQFWGEQAMQKLPALLGSTDMLCCAEDLGMIPTCVPEVMKSLYMLSLEIERMPKDPHDEFVQLPHIPYLSVCTTSTHDMAPIRLWWKEDRGLTQRYYNYYLGNWGDAPENCEPWICEQILNRHLYSPAMLVILPLQDWLSINGEHRRANEYEERINIPSDPHHFWCYRIHKNLEELISLNELNGKILEIVNNCGR